MFEAHGKEPYQLRNAVIEKEIIPAVRRIAIAKDLDCIDLHEVFSGQKQLFADGVHPNAAGSRLLAKTVYTRLKNQ